MYDSEKVYRYFEEESKNLWDDKSWRDFNGWWTQLRETASARSPFDPRFNAAHWAFDVTDLLRQIAFSYCWMRAYARAYRDEVKPGDNSRKAE